MRKKCERLPERREVGYGSPENQNKETIRYAEVNICQWRKT